MKNCWILPNGNVIECEYGHHADKAMELLDTHQDPSPHTDGLGWVKISCNPEGAYQVCFNRLITKAQRTSLWDICQQEHEPYPLDMDDNPTTTTIKPYLKHDP